MKQQLSEEEREHKTRDDEMLEPTRIVLFQQLLQATGVSADPRWPSHQKVVVYHKAEHVDPLPRCVNPLILTIPIFHA